MQARHIVAGRAAFLGRNGGLGLVVLVGLYGLVVAPNERRASNSHDVQQVGRVHFPQLVRAAIEALIGDGEVAVAGV